MCIRDSNYSDQLARQSRRRIGKTSGRLEHDSVMRLTRLRLIASLLVLLLLSACAGLPVRGSVGMQTIETRVDSEAARYYLEHYLAGKRSDAALDERIDRVYPVSYTHLRAHETPEH